jgi:heterodisulfide reductase subunit C
MSRPRPLGKYPEAAVVVESDRFLAEEIRERTGEEVHRCYHCRSCANGCPFIQAMDYPPNAVLRLVQYGLRQEVLGCKSIWICVACHTCSSQCPMGIDIAAIMGALRYLALEGGVPAAEPNILGFHREVLRSIERYGRTHKLGIMLRYKILTRRWFSDVDVGLKMLAKRKLDLKASRVEAMGEITPFFKPFREGVR